MPDFNKRQGDFLNALSKLPEYQGGSHEDIYSNFNEVFASGDSTRIYDFVNAIKGRIPEYQGGSAQQVVENIKEVFAPQPPDIFQEPVPGPVQPVEPPPEIGAPAPALPPPATPEPEAPPIMPGPDQFAPEIAPPSTTFVDTPRTPEEVDRMAFENDLELKRRGGQGFLQDTWLSFERGLESAKLDEMMARVSESKMGEGYDQVRAIKDEFEKRVQDDPTDANNWLSKTVLATAQMLGPMMRGIQEGQLSGLAGATTGATVAAIGGQIGPQILLPEEIFTVPAGIAMGYTTGAAWGASNYWRRQGGGAMYADLRKANVTHKNAALIAQLAGIPYALIESAQVARFIPKGIGSKLKNGLVKRAIELLKDRGIDITQEIAEEGVQQLIQETAQISGELSEGIIDSKEIPKRGVDALVRSWQVMVESAGPMALLMSPRLVRGSVNVMTGIRKDKAAEAPEIKTVTPEAEALEKELDQAIEEGNAAMFALRGKEGEINLSDKAQFDVLLEHRVKIKNLEDRLEAAKKPLKEPRELKPGELIPVGETVTIPKKPKVSTQDAEALLNTQEKQLSIEEQENLVKIYKEAGIIRNPPGDKLPPYFANQQELSKAEARKEAARTPEEKFPFPEETAEEQRARQEKQAAQFINVIKGDPFEQVEKPPKKPSDPKQKSNLRKIGLETASDFYKMPKDDQIDVLPSLNEAAYQEVLAAKPIEQVSKVVQPAPPEKVKTEIPARDVDLDPTPAQREAENYKKAHIRRDGMEVSIETPAGSDRPWIGPDGEKRKSVMNHDYGYIKGTKGFDKDHVDVVIKPKSPEGGPVFVVNQINPETKEFDEHKVMVGFETAKEAKKAYLSNYQKGWGGFGNIVPLDMDSFKDWVYSDRPVKGELKLTNKQKFETQTRLKKLVIKPKEEIPTPETALNLTKNPAGRFSFVGKVPHELAFAKGFTQEQVEAGELVGERFGPKGLSFKTEQEAVEAAEKLGYSVQGFEKKEVAPPIKEPEQVFPTVPTKEVPLPTETMEDRAISDELERLDLEIAQQEEIVEPGEGVNKWDGLDNNLRTRIVRFVGFNKSVAEKISKKTWGELAESTRKIISGKMGEILQREKAAKKTDPKEFYDKARKMIGDEGESDAVGAWLTAGAIDLKLLPTEITDRISNKAGNMAGISQHFIGKLGPDEALERFNDEYKTNYTESEFFDLISEGQRELREQKQSGISGSVKRLAEKIANMIDKGPEELTANDFILQTAMANEEFPEEISLDITGKYEAVKEKPKPQKKPSAYEAWWNKLNIQEKEGIATSLGWTGKTLKKISGQSWKGLSKPAKNILGARFDKQADLITKPSRVMGPVFSREKGVSDFPKPPDIDALLDKHGEKGVDLFADLNKKWKSNISQWMKNQKRPIVIESENLYEVVSPEPGPQRKEYPWRVTAFLKDKTPSGHHLYKTEHEAVLAAIGFSGQPTGIMFAREKAPAEINKKALKGLPDFIRKNEQAINSIIENRPVVSETNLKLAKEKGFETKGDLIKLYHGTRAGNKIRTAGMIIAGSYGATIRETAEQYAKKISKGPLTKIEVLEFWAPAGAGFLGSDGYFALNEPITFDGSGTSDYALTAPEVGPMFAREKGAELTEKAIKKFGITENFNEAGYMLPDGRMLDFSGKKEGGPGGERVKDHLEVESFMEESKSEAMVSFQRKGSVRLMPEMGGFDFQVEPNPAQYRELEALWGRLDGEVIIDLNDEALRESVEFDKGTSNEQIKSAIRRFYKGEKAAPSLIQRFHARGPTEITPGATPQAISELEEEFLSQLPDTIRNKVVLDINDKFVWTDTEGNKHSELLSRGQYGQRGAFWQDPDGTYRVTVRPGMPVGPTRQTMGHEILGHLGLITAMDSDFKIKKEFDRLYKIDKKSPWTKRLAERYKEDYDRILATDGKAAADKMMMQEWVANRYDDFADKKLTGQQKNIARRVYELVRKYMTDLYRKLAGKTKPTQQQIDDVIETAINSLKSARMQAVTPAAPARAIAPRAETFFSPTQKLVDGLQQKKWGSGVQAWQQIQNTQGAKKAEMDWMGLEEFLTEKKGKVTKDEILDFVKANSVQMETVFQVEKGTKYEQYTEPGGKDYRELLLTLPQEERVAEEPLEWRKNSQDLWAWFKGDSQVSGAFPEYGARNAAMPTITGKKITPKGFISGHFEPENIMAHIRIKTRTNSKGEKILFLEEIQSDWSIAARKGRLKDTALIKKAELKQMNANLDYTEFGQSLQKKYGLTENIVPPGFGDITVKDVMVGEGLSESDAKKLEDLYEKLSVARNELADVSGGIADFPIRKNWEEVVLKKMLRYAAGKGFDRMAWVTGKQTIERYKLSKKISRVRYNQGTKLLSAYDLNGKNVLNEGLSDEGQIEKYIGKGVSEKLLKKEKNSFGDRELSGLDLDVGGEWAINLYDRKIPSFLKKYGKKWGAKPEMVGVRFGELANPPVYDGPTMTEGEIEKLIPKWEASGIVERERQKYETMLLQMQGLVQDMGLGMEYTLAKRMRGSNSLLDYLAEKQIDEAEITTEQAQKILDELKVKTKSFPDFEEDVDFRIIEKMEDVGKSMKSGLSFKEAMSRSGSAALANEIGGSWTIPTTPDELKQPSIAITDAMKTEVMEIGQPLFARGKEKELPQEELFPVEREVAIGEEAIQPKKEQVKTEELPEGDLFHKPEDVKQMLLFSRAPKMQQDLVGKDLFTTFALPSETQTERMRRKMQDKFVRLQTAQRAIEKATGKRMAEEFDVDLEQELLTGVTKHKLDEFEKNHVRPINQYLAKSDLDIYEVGLYMMARHASERNAHIQKINKLFREKNIPGSGMSDETASSIIENFSTRGKAGNLEKAAQMLDTVLAENRKRLVENGLETAERVANWEEVFKHYTPLKGFEVDPADWDPGTQSFAGGKGFDVRGKKKGATGRVSLANIENIVPEILLESERDIVQAEKSKVGRKFLNLVRQFPNDDLWIINEAKYSPRFNKKTGEVTYAIDPSMTLKETVLSVKEDGVEYHITMKDVGLARAMKNLGAETGIKAILWAGGMNRALAALNTKYNPSFFAANLSRDVITATLNISIEHGFVLAAKTIKDVPSAMRGAYNATRGNYSSKWAKHFDEFSKHGGKVEFLGMEEIEGRQKRLANEISRLNGKVSPIKMYKSALDLIEAINRSSENATRLAFFKNLRDRGVSPKRAAQMAKNITVNFNKKGEWGSNFNSMYMFGNAAIQANARLLTLMKADKRWALKPPDSSKAEEALAKVMTGPAKHKRAWGMASGGVALSFAFSELMRHIGGEDEEGENNYDKIPNWIKDNNMVIPLPWGTQIMVPLPYGYNVFWAVGQHASAVIHGKDPITATADIIAAGASAMNPFGSSSTVVQTALPTQIRWIGDLVVNKNFFGGPIYKRQLPFGIQLPPSELYFKGVNPQIRAVTDYINRLTGGTKYQKGRISINPEYIEYFAKYFTGGFGAFIDRTAQLTANSFSRKPPLIGEIPIIRRFYREQDTYHSTKRYYDHMDRLQIVTKELRDAKESGPEELQAAAKKYEKYRYFITVTRNEAGGVTGKSPYSQIKNLVNKERKSIRELQKTPPSKEALEFMLKKKKAKNRGEIIDKHKEEISRAQSEFNKDWNKRIGVGKD